VDSFVKAAPFGAVRHWLGVHAVERLLRHVEFNESLFKESEVYGKARRVDHTVRRSSLLLKINNLVNEIELNTKIHNALPIMFKTLGNTPFVPCKFEFELAAHGDGAFFSRHVDTAIQKEGFVSDRIISAVYYFHALPKAFSGGVLRLHSLAPGHQQATFVDIEPDYDTLVFFPSWYPHEVLPVHVPSGRFLDSRFAINCWVHRDSRQSIAPPIRESSKY
jgi:Rps23 Pro-64 3,4-dihydroxylase Tpa1-like proline 4-hydroxylase